MGLPHFESGGNAGGEIGIIIAIIIIVYLGRIHRPFFFRRLLDAYTEENLTGKILKILKLFGNFRKLSLEIVSKTV